MPICGWHLCYYGITPFSLKSIAMVTDDTSDSEDLLKVRRKSKREQVTEEKDYMRWLKGERAQMDKKYAKEMVSSCMDRCAYICVSGQANKLRQSRLHPLLWETLPQVASICTS